MGRSVVKQLAFGVFLGVVMLAALSWSPARRWWKRPRPPDRGGRDRPGLGRCHPRANLPARRPGAGSRS